MTKPNKRTKATGSEGRREPRPERPCSFPGCGRPSYARGLCQTHHRQQLEIGELRTIRPYRERIPGTVKFAGLRLTSFAADRIQEYADSHGLSVGAAIAAILEGSLASGKRRRAPRSNRA